MTTMPRTGEAFRPSRQLRMWMAVAVLGSLLSLVLIAGGAAVLLVVLANQGDTFRFVVVAVTLAVLPFAGWKAAKTKDRRGHRRIADADAARLARVSERLTLMADTTAVLEIDDDRVPVAWTSAGLRGPAEVHVTTALLDCLDDRELSAVVAHELAHVLHRDALVMTLVARPGVALLHGLRSLGFNTFTGAIWLLSPLMLASFSSARLLSRHRELAADRTAAMVLGSGAALAAALQKLDGTHQSLPDLRSAGARDVLHVLPLEAPPRLFKGVRATHPPLQRRLDELMRIEARLQRSRKT